MKTLKSCKPRQSVLDGTADFVVNLADLRHLTDKEAQEFLDSTVLTAGMERFLMQAFSRLAGNGVASGIYKLSESMGGGKTQSMIVAGILALYPSLASKLPFKKLLPEANPEVVASFTGRSTDKKIWVRLGEILGTELPSHRAPSEDEWRKLLNDRSVLILLDELAFYLAHTASQGSESEGRRAATLTAAALTTLFGTVRDYKECRRCVIVVADLQKDWEQGGEALSQIILSSESLSGDIRSVNNEISKGAQTIVPVNNTSDELYAILRKRIFENIDASEEDVKLIANAYYEALKNAESVIDRPIVAIREEILASYPFHFSVKHLIGQFNDNPGFQKTRDVIKLLATIVRSLWGKGNEEIDKHILLSLQTADFNDGNVSSRFIAIKNSLQEALQTDIANSGTSKSEALDAKTNGLASRCAQWLFTASLSEIHPRGLSEEELIEYLIAPGQSITGLNNALKAIFDTCWYVEQTPSGRYYFHKQKNLNAQINSYVHICTSVDRDKIIADKLNDMFYPHDKRCYQNLIVLPALDTVQLERDKSALVICKPETDIQKFFRNEKYKNRVIFLTAVDQNGMFYVNKKAGRLWAVSQVVDDLTVEDQQYQKAKKVLANYQADLFIVLKSVFNTFYYPIVDDDLETALECTSLLDAFYGESLNYQIQFANENMSKGEKFIEATLRDAGKFHDSTSDSGKNKVEIYSSLKLRVEKFLFPPTKHATWNQILDSAASRGHMIWTVPNTLELMRDTLIQAGEWRKEASQIQIPPFKNVTGVTVEHIRDNQTGIITTTDVRLSYADQLFVREDEKEWTARSKDQPVESCAMLLEFKAVDSTGQNEVGKIYRIENSVDIVDELLVSPKPNHKVLKVKCIPSAAKLLFTTNGSDPVNNGHLYTSPGIEAAEGSTVRLCAQYRGVDRQKSIYVPKQQEKDDNVIDPAKLTLVKGTAFNLDTRLDISRFLSNLPEGTHLQLVQASITHANTDSRVRLNWSERIRLKPSCVQKGFEFLDNQIEHGEWSLMFKKLEFKTGNDLLQWQVDTDQIIDFSCIKQ